MCTVSFIPVKDKVFITSNRDEKNIRQSAIVPTLYNYKGCKLVFPKDADKGGTWIAMKENGYAGVLLNGAFLPHLPAPGYRMSRGVLFLDVLSAERPLWEFKLIKLDGIEPFTIILVENACLYECRWDGAKRYCKQLAASRPHIWSSATLYDGLVMKKREHWFASFLNQHPNPTRKDILDFHRFSGDGDVKNDLLMERDGLYSTVSITSLLLTKNRGSMQYLDMKTTRSTEINIELLQTITS